MVEEKRRAIKLSGPYDATRELRKEVGTVAVAKEYLRQNKGTRLGTDVAPHPSLLSGKDG